MKATLHTGLPSSPAHAPVSYRSATSNEVLRRVSRNGVAFWALDPYSGCEFGCISCQARQGPPFADGEFHLFERDIHIRTNAPDEVQRAARAGNLKLPVALGVGADPWQPVEERAQLTRRVLKVLSEQQGLDVRVQTRSTLVTRDTDLLLALGRQGKLSVGFSIPTADRKLARLLEPQAPTPDRRFVAMEALARAGVRVGILVTPVVAGLNDAWPAMEALLRRARDCGATFTGAAPLQMAPATRMRIVHSVAHHDPELATRYDRLLARCANLEPGFAERLAEHFDELSERLGLHNAWKPPRREERPHGDPRQLSLF